MNPLKVFVSSTCYDLSQVRADLYDFITDCGYQPVLSEYNSFPISPDNDTITNCIDNVKTADIFVLIIGTRYGSIFDNKKSITNTEYLYAKQLNIPTYVFIHKDIVPLISVWKNNKTADFSASVDSPLIFRFVDEVRTVDRNWCFEFEKAQEIVRTIKIQLSYMFKRTLDLQQKLLPKPVPEYWSKISPLAIDIILKKETLYELRFFTQTLGDELQKYEDLRLDSEYRILFSCNKRVIGDKEILDWMGEQFQSLGQFIDTASVLFNDAYKKYYAEDGVPSDLKGLYYVASSLARLYQEMMRWSINIASTYVNEEHLLLKNLFSRYIINSADKIWEYPISTKKQIEDALERLAVGDEQIHITAVLTLTVDEQINSALLREFDKIRSRY